jgi:hypothetical protein
VGSKLGLVVLVLLLCCAPNVLADTFQLTATGSGTNINLVLTGTLASPGVYDISGLTGTVDGFAATLLATSGPGVVTNNFTGSIETTYDNILFLGSPHFDDNGLAFISNGIIGNLYYSGGYVYSELGGKPPILQSVSMKVVRTPEPGALLFIGAGGLLLAGFLLIRK